MLTVRLWILFILVKCLHCQPIIETFSTVDLLENSQLNTFVIQLIEQLTSVDNSSTKLVRLNLSGFERDLFSIIHGSLYTKGAIDREEMLAKKYCMNKFYTRIF